jgi:cyclic pyranopterin monophosphate synthase
MSLSHFDESGAARMVNVGDKPVTERFARASARIRMLVSTLELVEGRRASKKGDVLQVARLAGIMAAKRTSELIPLCHPLALDQIAVEFETPAHSDAEPKATQTVGDAALTFLQVAATVSCTGRTGVEMEALCAASVAALTVYDMCKSVDREMVIEQIRLDEKAGGRSGHFQRL